MNWLTRISVVLFITAAPIQSAHVDDSVIPHTQALPDSMMWTPLWQIHNLRLEGQLNEARDLALSYLKSNPNDVDALFELGLIYYQKQQFDKAIQPLDKALKIAPSYVDVRLTLIKCYLATKQLATASQVLDTGGAQTPNQQLQLYRLKSELNNTIKPEDIITNVEPNLPSYIASFKPGILDTIKTLRAQGKVKQAYDKAINYLKTHPNDVDVQVQFGLMAFQQAHLNEANSYLEKALNQAPNYLDARLGLIRTKIALHQYQQGLQLIIDGLRNHSGKSELLRLAEQIHALQHPKIIARESKPTPDKQNDQQKKQAYLHDLQLTPRAYETRLKLADLYLKYNKDNFALGLIKKGLSLEPNNIPMLLKKAEIESILRRYGLVDLLAQRVLKLDPGNKQALGYLREVDDISPRYRYGIKEFGIYSNNAYVSDLHKVWNYSSIFYNREGFVA